MIVKKGHPLFAKVKLVDIAGNEIPWAFYFNTKTYTTKMFIPTQLKGKSRKFAISGKTFIGPDSKNNKVATATAVIKGAKLVNRLTGEVYK